MSSAESFDWIHGGTAWGVVAAGTTVLLVLAVIVLVLCMRADNKDHNEKEKDPALFKDSSYCGGPYSGAVSVPMSCKNDGIGPMGPRGPLHPLGPPPPYSLVTSAEQVQPETERRSPMMFGFRGAPFSPQVQAPPIPAHKNGNGIRLPAPPQNGNHLRPISPRPDSHSNYSNSEEEEETPGKIWFTAHYDKGKNVLEVEVLKARMVAVRDRSSTLSESFIKVYLLPDEQNAYQTKSKRKTITPKFNEKFTFIVSPEELQNRVLRLSAYVMDRRSVRSCLGHILVNLEDIDIDAGDTVVKELTQHSQPSNLGEVNLSLLYQPQTDRLSLTVNKCRNLKKLPVETATEFEAPSVFIKSQLICGRKQLDQKTSSVKPARYDLDFNDQMTFTLTQKQMGNSSIILTLMTSKPSELGVPFEEINGSVTIGPYMFAHGDELRHWQDMVATPGASVTKWHSLR